MIQSQINKTIKKSGNFIAAKLKRRQLLEQQMDFMQQQKNLKGYGKLMRRAQGINEEVRQAEINIKRSVMTPKNMPTYVQKTPGRNEECFCGSGKKFKKCCLDKTEENIRKALIKMGKKSAA